MQHITKLELMEQPSPDLPEALDLVKSSTREVTAIHTQLRDTAVTRPTADSRP
jgi:hypothetical protein